MLKVVVFVEHQNVRILLPVPDQMRFRSNSIVFGATSFPGTQVATMNGRKGVNNIRVHSAGCGFTLCRIRTYQRSFGSVVYGSRI